MHIVTVATEDEGYFKFLKESCERNGAKLEVLGWNTPWQGFSYKIKLMHEYLQTLPNDNDIVCFVDGYDVIILQHVNKIQQLFEQSGHNILISRDIEASISKDLYLSLLFGKCHNYRINAGSFIGRVKNLKQMYKEIIQKYDLKKHKDDQVILTNICNQNKDIGIDLKRELFLVINSEDKNISKLVVHNKQLMFGSTYPCILHAPANYDINHLLEGLGYDTSSMKKRDKMKYFKNSPAYPYVCILLIIIIVLITFLIIFMMLRRK
jgi:hypothetical protein